MRIGPGGFKATVSDLYESTTPREGQRRLSTGYPAIFFTDRYNHACIDVLAAAEAERKSKRDERLTRQAQSSERHQAARGRPSPLPMRAISGTGPTSSGAVDVFHAPSRGDRPISLMLSETLIARGGEGGGEGGSARGRWRGRRRGRRRGWRRRQRRHTARVLA